MGLSRGEDGLSEVDGAPLHGDAVRAVERFVDDLVVEDLVDRHLDGHGAEIEEGR